MTGHFDATRRGLIASLAATGLAGCMGSARDPSPSEPRAPAPGAQAPPGSAIGSGSIRIALILPLTGPEQGAAAARSLRNAAELSLSEFQNPDLSILVKDDRGSPEGAREAVAQALAEGAEIIIGPLFASSVQAAGGLARPAGRPVVAFSTDASVAARGVYLLSFLAQTEVDRVIDYAAAQGRRSVAALIPETPYGTVVEAQFREAAAARSLRVPAIERYAPGEPREAARRLAPLLAGPAPKVDALFAPDGADGLAALDQALQAAGFNPARVKLLGTGVWNEARLFGLPSLQGGWFAAPDNRGFNALAARYRARYGEDPTRLATLSYDAVSLAAALARTQGSQRFSEEALTNPAGFAGADGVFRLRPDGTNERALAVQEIRGGGASIVSPAPRVLPGA